MKQPRIYHSRFFGKIALCAAFALTACSTGGGSGSAIPVGADHISRAQAGAFMPGSSGSSRSVAGDSASSEIAYWVIGASDYCPSAKETITIQIAAANSQGALISGTYSSPILLSDSDKSGATKLSTTRVPKAGQKVTLSYSGKSVPAFQVLMKVGTASSTVTFAPGKSCINAAPANIVARDGAAGTAFSVTGVGIAGPFSIKLPTSGSGCGSAVKVKKQGAQFVLTSATTQYGYCYIEVVSKANALSNIGVMILKK